MATKRPLHILKELCLCSNYGSSSDFQIVRRSHRSRCDRCTAAGGRSFGQI
ncbi:hypothetical protein AVEN_226601-1, partial [Araneus ventricosus]